MATRARPLLSVRDLKTHFLLDEGVVRPSTGSASTSTPARVFGIVGESGCGKSVTMKSVLRIVETPGKIVRGQILLRRPVGTGRAARRSSTWPSWIRERRGDALDPRRRRSRSSRRSRWRRSARCTPSGTRSSKTIMLHQSDRQEGGARISPSTCCGTWASRCPSSAWTHTPGSSAAGCASAPSSPWPSPATPACSSPTSRPPPST